MLKRILILTLATLTTTLTVTAKAEVVKPTCTDTAATGTTQIAELNFDYSVSDRGWRTHAEYAKNETKIEAEKSFILDFQMSEKSNPDTKIKSENENSMSNQIGAEATQKCQELGQLEYTSQTAQVPAEYKLNFSAEIVNGSVSYVYSPIGRYVCLVKVTAFK